MIKRKTNEKRNSRNEKLRWLMCVTLLSKIYESVSICANGICGYVQVLNCETWHLEEEEEKKNEKDTSHLPYTILVQSIGIFRQFLFVTLFWLFSMPLLITSMFQAEPYTASHEHQQAFVSPCIGFKWRYFVYFQIRSLN